MSADEVFGRGRDSRRIPDALTKDKDTADFMERIKNYRMHLVPTGALIRWPTGATIPSNTLTADGSAVSRTKYSALFQVLGTTQGAGDGSTTFNLPTLANHVVQT